MIRVFPRLLAFALLPAAGLFGAVARAEPAGPVTPPPVAEGEDQEDLLGFIAATQLQTSAQYSKLSFKADVTNHAYVRELDTVVPIRSKYDVLRRSQTSLVTKTLLTTFKGGDLSEPKRPLEISSDPNVTRLLQTMDYLMIWRNVAIPHVSIWFAEDWKLQSATVESKSDDTYRQVKIERLCFGLGIPLYEAIHNVEFAPRWVITPSRETGFVNVERQVHGLDQPYIRDLHFLVESQTGIVRKADFMPAGGPVAATTSIQYTVIELSGKPTIVPSSYFAKYHDSPEREQSTDIVFFSYSDETRMAPFSVEGFGVPVGARITRRSPSSPDEFIVWDGTDRQINNWRTRK